MKVRFAKMHGLGNDFVVLDCMDGREYDFATLAKRLCKRRTSVGADGLLALLPDPEADCRMRIFNADGTEAQMCGNGIRCAGKYIFDRGICPTLTPSVNTRAGMKKLIIRRGSDGLAATVCVDMGAPELTASRVPVTCPAERMVDMPVSIPGADVRVTAVGMGNPHGVVFVDDVYTYPLPRHGRALERHDIWPEKANIEFVEVREDSRLVQRTWERGVGETLACGTGACAAAVAAVLTGRATWPVTVDLLGGTLEIDFRLGHVMMTGAATYLFEAEIEV